MKVCPDCEGTGVIEQGDEEDDAQCPTCGGTGFVADDDDGDGREGILQTSAAGLKAYMPSAAANRSKLLGGEEAASVIIA